MPLNASTLRSDIYRILDKVIDTGQPVEITRKGHKLLIVAEKKSPKMSRLVKHTCLKGSPESIVHLDWSKEWKNDLP